MTGLSDAGRSRAVNAPEDVGFYCVGNAPPKLIPTFYDFCSQAKGGPQRAAAATDICGGTLFDSLSKMLALMRGEGKKYRILFLGAGDSVPINRFKETRRKHPLAEGYLGSLEQVMQTKRQILRTVQECSNYIIDTSFLSLTQFEGRISSLFLGDTLAALIIHCASLGFKYGLPPEANLVFDVRCLPNPFYVEELKRQTGPSGPVREHVMKWDQARGLVTRSLDMADCILPLYCDEGESQLATAIGYIGGHHRSAAFAQLLYNHLLKDGKWASVNHRDIYKQEKYHIVFARRKVRNM